MPYLLQPDREDKRRLDSSFVWHQSYRFRFTKCIELFWRGRGQGQWRGPRPEGDGKRRRLVTDRHGSRLGSEDRRHGDNNGGYSDQRRKSDFGDRSQRCADAGGSFKRITNGKIQIDGGTLSDNGGLTIGSGATLVGKGTVNGPITGSGSGVVKASGGVLDLKGTVNGGVSLQIDTAAGSVLKIDGTATTTAAIAISNAKSDFAGNGPSGALTLGAAESITNGKIQIDGGTLTDNAGLTISSGATVRVGTAAVAGHIVGSVSVLGSSATLDVANADLSGVGLYTVDNSQTYLRNSSTAGTATINNDAYMNFYDTSTAGSSQLSNGGDTWFNDYSTAGSAQISTRLYLLHGPQHGRFGPAHLDRCTRAAPPFFADNSTSGKSEHHECRHRLH